MMPEVSSVDIDPFMIIMKSIYLERMDTSEAGQQA